MKENSIKNERSSIKEDIKDIGKYISFTSKRENFSHDTDWNWNKDLANKIENILSDYKRVLQLNEKYKEFFDLMLRLDSDYFMNCGDEETNKLVDEILKLESE